VDAGAFDKGYAEDAAEAQSVADVSVNTQAARKYTDMRRTAQEYVRKTWLYPAGAQETPCAEEKCPLYLVSGSLTDQDEAHLGERVLANGAAGIWVRPRIYIGLKGGEPETGVPYSIGGDDTPELLAEKLKRFGLAGSHLPPVGHIGEALSTHSEKDKKTLRATYPAGIDCSALVAAIWKASWTPTATMATLRADELATGPDKGCPLPVRHFSELKPGDVMFKDGHVVLFDGVNAIGGTNNSTGSFGVRVYEATSRCGRVCVSVYDIDFFNGWWMYRRQDSDAECPTWTKPKL
jgi:hypothetical protein